MHHFGVIEISANFMIYLWGEEIVTRRGKESLTVWTKLKISLKDKTGTFANKDISLSLTDEFFIVEVVVGAGRKGTIRGDTSKITVQKGKRVPTIIYDIIELLNWNDSITESLLKERFDKRESFERLQVTIDKLFKVLE